MGISVAMGSVFLIVGLGIYFIALGNTSYIFETIPYATLISAFVFVGSTTFLDYKTIEIKKSLLVGGILGVVSFFVVISLIEGVLFLLETNLTQKIIKLILIAFSLCIILSSILLWIAKSKFY